MKLKFETVGQLEDAFSGIAETIGLAAFEALGDTMDDAKDEGRRSIAAAGFSRKWQNSLRANIYANGQIAEMKGAAAIFHKIGYAGVFEEGSRISGKPMMWVPVPGLPKRVARQKLTPEVFEKKVGPLFSVPQAGGTPMLWAKIDVSAAAAKRGPPYKPVMAGLYRGADGKGKNIRAVPVFMGLRSVSIKKKFDVTGAVERASKRLPDHYEKHLRRLLKDGG